MTIRGPKDLSEFRNDPTEWTGYVDPLPSCDIAEASDEFHQSVSKVKEAWPKFLGPWIAGEAAKAAYKFRAMLPEMTEDEVRDLIAPASDRARDAAAARGHEIHTLLEHLLDGGTFDGLLDVNHAMEYLAVLQALATDLAPTVVASEVVTFGEHEGDRWAGTFDAIWHLEGAKIVPDGDYLVDYKSRKMGKAATRYPEEGVQLGAYNSASYWIVEDAHGAIGRMQPLEVSGGLVVSIAPDGYKLYPVDMQLAREHWLSTLQFRRTMDTGRAMFGKPVGAKVTPTETAPETVSPTATDAPATVEVEPPPDATVVTIEEAPSAGWMRLMRTAWLLARVDAIREANHLRTLTEAWRKADLEAPKPAAVRDGKAEWTYADIDAIVPVIDAVEARWEMPFGDPDPALVDAMAAERVEREAVEAEAQAKADARPVPLEAPEDDGTLATDEEITSVRSAIAALAPEEREHLTGWLHQGADAGMAWNTGPAPTVRRAAITTAAVNLVAYRDPSDTAADADQIVRMALAWITDLPTADHAVGAILGTLTIEQATKLVAMLDTSELSFDNLGAPSLTAGE